MTKTKMTQLTDDEIREIMLQYFYDRNKNATSIRGKSKRAAAVPISVIRRDLKEIYGFSASQVVSNLNYLMSQGWVEEKSISKSFPTPRGGIVPSATSFYIITAAGEDKVCGPSEFTRDRFQGIKIEATGQNIITLGDGNQVNASYKLMGEALADLRKAVKATDKLTDIQKLEVVADIDCIQDQLAKPNPNKIVVQNLWEQVHRAASLAGLMDFVVKIVPFIASLI